MRIATWNVNSIRARVGRVTDWLQRADVDVLAMQEIKCRDDQFPHEAFETAGYEVVTHGHSQWNGVAIASRVGLSEVEPDFPGMPGFGKALPDGSLPARGSRPRRRPSATASASGACTCRTGATSRIRTTPTSSPGWTGCAR